MTENRENEKSSGDAERSERESSARKETNGSRRNSEKCSGAREEEDGMEDRFPDSTREQRDAGRFLGANFPYVPGDPFW